MSRHAQGYNWSAAVEDGLAQSTDSQVPPKNPANNNGNRKNIDSSIVDDDEATAASIDPSFNQANTQHNPGSDSAERGSRFTGGDDDDDDNHRQVVAQAVAKAAASRAHQQQNDEVQAVAAAAAVVHRGAQAVHHHQHQLMGLHHHHHLQQDTGLGLTRSPPSPSSHHHLHNDSQTGSPPLMNNSNHAGRPLTNTKRAEQNRQAQRAFRQRKELYIKDLETKVNELKQSKDTIDALRQENIQLRDYILALQSRLIEHPGGVPTPPAVYATRRGGPGQSTVGSEIYEQHQRRKEK